MLRDSTLQLSRRAPFFLSGLHVVLGCFSGEMMTSLPPPPQAGLILFYSIDETG